MAFALQPRLPAMGGIKGETFGPYTVYEELGVGGMAIVHRAKKVGIAGFERVVALKRLLPHLIDNDEFVRSFVREAKLASLLQHANIAHIYELGRVDSTYFIAMEYVEGYDARLMIREAARRGVVPPIGVILHLLGELCEALEYAHTRRSEDGEPLGIVHRDISPGNVIVTRTGHVKVIDFGIAKARPEQLKTDGGQLKGKFGYMAPEALRGVELDSRSDLFSVGVVGHELIAARRLFGAKHNYESLARIHRVDVEPPSRYNPMCSAALDEVILRALARHPEDRWQSAQEMLEALHAIAIADRLTTNSDKTSDWIDYLFGDPAEVLFTTPPLAIGSSRRKTPAPILEAATIVESIEELGDVTWIEDNEFFWPPEPSPDPFSPIDTEPGTWP